MISLACAGKVVRAARPGFKAADFGGNTLTDILLATGQFEVVSIPHEAVNGRSIYYRSIDSRHIRMGSDEGCTVPMSDIALRSDNQDE